MTYVSTNSRIFVLKSVNLDPGLFLLSLGTGHQTRQFDVFESLFGRLDTLNVEFYIMGDINCNLGAPELDHNSRFLNDIANLFSYIGL